jgi:hypothetical protein
LFKIPALDAKQNHVHMLRFQELTFSYEKCLDECQYEEYVTDVSSTKMTSSLIRQLTKGADEHGDPFKVVLCMIPPVEESYCMYVRGKGRGAIARIE